MKKLYLIVAKGKQKGLPIPIKVDLFLVGSDTSCQLRSKLPGIGTQHCALVMRDKKVFVRDLDNGKTLVNDELIPPGEEWPVHAGDRLEVGPLEFMVQFNEKMLSRKDAEEWALKSLDREAARSDAAKEGEEHIEDESGEVRAAPPPPPPDTAAAAAAEILDKLSAQRGVIKGRLRVNDHEDIRILRFNDSQLVEVSEIVFIRKELLSHLEGRNATRRVLIDFKNVIRMSSAAGEMLTEVRRRIQGSGGALALCRVRPDLQLILEALGFMAAIPHFPKKEVALTERW